MPLARIITSNSKYSDGLADDLRSRGFQVLTSAPGDKVSESADLEITLNECLPEEARAAAVDLPVTKDMRVFVTPRAFAGNIRSIEMFVLTSTRPGAQLREIEMPIEPSLDVTSTPAGKLLEVAMTLTEILPPAMSSSVNATPHEQESVEPNLGGVIGRVFPATTEAAAPAWPNIAEMKLFPVDLSPVAIKATELQQKKIAAPISARADFQRPSQKVASRRFGKIAAIAAALVLLAAWFTYRSSVSQASYPGVQTPIGQNVSSSTAPASVSARESKSGEKLPPSLSSGAPRHAAKAKKHPVYTDYVAKDTTVYFDSKPRASRGDQKPQARP